MGMDLHNKGAGFRRQLLADVEELIKRLISGVGATIAAQQDGVGVSNQYRALNFQGDGVEVSIDPAMNRTNIVIPGAPTASTADTSVYSAAGAPRRARTLWNGSSNDAPPSGWQNAGFVDSGWSLPVATSTGNTFSQYTPGVAIADTTSPPAGNPVEQILLRHTFTLPAGTIASASLRILADSALNGAYINGTLVGSHPDTSWATTDVPIGAELSVSPALLVAGGSNVLALMSTNTLVPSAKGGIVYRLTVNYVGAGADARYQLLSEKDQPDGYAGLDSDGLVLDAVLADSGTPSGSTFLRGDRSWAAASTNSITVQEVDASPSVAVTTLRFPNGTLTNDGGGQVTYTAASVGTTPYILLEDQKAQNTNGGGLSSGSDQIRTLNTIVTDTDNLLGGTLASNQFVLPAGTYEIDATAPAFGVNRHQAFLYNVTDTAVAKRGTSEINAGTNESTRSRIVGRFVIAGTKTFEIRHRVNTTNGTNGAGVEANFGTEIYTVVQLRKVG